MNLLNAVRVQLAVAGAAAGTSDVTGATIDMSGFEGVVFVGTIAAHAANNFIQVEQDTASGMGTAAALEGTKVLAGTNGNAVAVDVYRPRERYVRAVIKRGTSTATGDVYALLYGAHVQPVTHGTTVVAETHQSPAEGTP